MTSTGKVLPETFKTGQAALPPKYFTNISGLMVAEVMIILNSGRCAKDRLIKDNSMSVSRLLS